MPLEDDEGVSLSDIYGSALVEEDIAATRKSQKPNKQSSNKGLDSTKDMFYVNEKLAKRIFMKGEVGHGKTVFCLKVIELWAKAKSSNESISKEKSSNEAISEENSSNKSVSDDDKSRNMSISEGNAQKSTHSPQYETTEHTQSQYEQAECKHSLTMQADDESELGECLSQFDLVFYVPLRYSKHDESSIVDLVCGSVSGCEKSEKEKIKQMLGDRKISCLVLLDGLDEWRAPSVCRVQGFPDSDDLVNNTVLCTLRPWRMVDLQLRLDSTCDKVVQILGLKGTSVEVVISNVLVHFCGLDITSSLYKNQFKRFCQNAAFPLLKPLMKIPLMLSAACLIWNEEGDISTENAQNAQNFMTFFYLKLIELMISRAEIKNTNVSRFLCEKRESPNLSLRIPGLLSEFNHVVDFLDVITPVGRLALKDLVSEDSYLVFQKCQLERNIGQTLVELALKSGILTQAKAPGLSYQQRVSVNFFHKSIQEFMAALVICVNRQDFDVLCQHCTTVDKVMELSNVIMFVCGLNPDVGSYLADHVKCVINADADILQYRDSLCKTPMLLEFSRQDQIKVKELYEIHCRFFSEMKSSLAHTPDRNHIQNVHAPDILLDWESSSDVFEITKDLLFVENNDIVSVCLIGEYCINDHILHIIPNLPNCKDLVSLHISGNDYSDYTAELQRTLRQLSQLKCLYLSDISLTYSLALNDMPQLQAVTLGRVNPEYHILPYLWLCSQLKQIKLISMTLIDDVRLAKMPQLDTVAIDSVRCAYFMLVSLPKCTHLTSLDISCLDSMEDRMLLASVLPRLVHLHYINYRVYTSQFDKYLYDHGDVAVVVALKQLTKLRHIELEGIWFECDSDIGKTIRCVSDVYHGTKRDDSESDEEGSDCAYDKEYINWWIDSNFRYTPFTRRRDNDEHQENDDPGPYDDDTLQVTPDMKQLEEIQLTRIEMSPRQWSIFINSLLNVQHTVHVTLCETNIDERTVSIIKSSPHFKVSQPITFKSWHLYQDITFSRKVIHPCCK